MGGTKGGGKPGTWVGTLPLKPKNDDDRLVRLGYEHGCPGRDVHLGMRFKNQPPGALDGQPFPAAAWEQSPYYITKDYPIELSGIKGMTKGQIRLVGTGGGQTPWFDRDDWRDKITKAPKVTASWFVVHDTDGGDVPTKTPTSGDKGAHLFLGKGKIFLNKDFSTQGTAVRFEWSMYHPEFRGHMIHCEVVNKSKDEGPYPKDVYAPSDYYYVAMAYVNASYRKGEWLTVTCHLETDRGIDGAHHDPRGFDFEKLYRIVGILVPGADGTFGILNARVGDNLNQRDYKNTFPMQYGAVEREGVINKPAMKTFTRKT